MPPPALHHWDENAAETITHAKADAARFGPQAGCIGMLKDAAVLANLLHSPQA